MTSPDLTLAPVAHAEGTVALPGSKSISNRVLLIAALADGVTCVEGVLEADDTDRMLEALERLGVDVERDRAARRCIVRGAGGAFAVRAAKLMLGNAGTAFRPLTAVLATQGGDYELDGVARMRERPIGDLVDALRALGADVRYLGSEGFPPLAVGPSGARAGGTVPIRGDVSSQFLTALLMALPLARGADRQPTRVAVTTPLISRPYVEITTRLMRRFGVEVETPDASTFVVPAGARYASPGTIVVEGDASSASYFLAAGVLGGGPVRVTGIGRDAIQGDVAFADVLARLGADVRFGPDWIEARTGAPLAGGTIDCTAIPDAAMTLAITALAAREPTTLTGIASWRVKETDRIAAMAAELRKVGATVDEAADRLTVHPASALRHAAIDTYDDHRMAMCFSLVSLLGIAVTIRDPTCVRKTFPGYFDAFRTLATPASEGSLPPVVAIDGPAASGKGTVAARVARALGFHLLDSGALYRLVALKAIRDGVAFDDEAALARIARDLDASFDERGVTLAGTDATAAIRDEAVSEAASRVAVHPGVRAALLERQRAFRRRPGLVADGRDMGTVVFPDAATKVFVTATPEARASRRQSQLAERGVHADLSGLLDEIRARDERDAGRAVAPLRPADDAVVLDTTALTIEQATAYVLDRHAQHAH
jgi:3-phosphoshikimate 1-carboxyvinyltransferase